jgi:AhpD family alkylhydroperoxidase
LDDWRFRAKRVGSRWATIALPGRGENPTGPRLSEEDTMGIHSSIAILAAAAGFGALATLSGPTVAEEMTAEEAYADIERTLGTVPSFFRAVPESGIAGAWAEMKGVQMNPDTALDGKTKELLGLAVASQIPCHYCIYFHTLAAKANGLKRRNPPRA